MWIIAAAWTLGSFYLAYRLGKWIEHTDHKELFSEQYGHNWE